MIGKMIEKTIMLRDKPLFWLGDKFYKVEPFVGYGPGRSVKVEFSSKCPYCNDTREITYKGYNGDDFKCECPVCRGGVGRGYGNRIELTNWEIHEYIVYEVNARGLETISSYKDGAACMESISLKAFYRFGRCADEYITTQVPVSNIVNRVDKNVEEIDTDIYSFDSEDYVFTKKSDATKFLKVLQERDKRRLVKFNETYETKYEYPFE